MAAATEAVSITKGVNPSSPMRFPLKSAAVAYPNAWMGIISYNHASDATLGGQMLPFTGTAGEIPLGRYLAVGNDVDYTIARNDGSALGDGTATYFVDVTPRIISKIVIPGATALTEAAKPLYLADDQTYTLTKGAGILGTAVGYIISLDDITTGECTIREFGYEQIYQNVIEEEN